MHHRRRSPLPFDATSSPRHRVTCLVPKATVFVSSTPVNVPASVETTNACIMTRIVHHSTDNLGDVFPHPRYRYPRATPLTTCTGNRACTGTMLTLSLVNQDGSRWSLSRHSLDGPTHQSRTAVTQGRERSSFFLPVTPTDPYKIARASGQLCAEPCKCRRYEHATSTSTYSFPSMPEQLSPWLSIQQRGAELPGHVAAANLET